MDLHRGGDEEMRRRAVFGNAVGRIWHSSEYGGPDMRAQVGEVEGTGGGPWLFNIVDVARNHPVLTFNFASREAAESAHSKMQTILADTIEVHFHRY